MATQKDRLIADLVGDSNDKEEIDKSLKARAYQRATEQTLPKTMTPWEWEEWYAMHGTPEEHLSATPNEPPENKQDEETAPLPWWRRLFSNKRQTSKPPPNCVRSTMEDSEF